MDTSGKLTVSSARLHSRYEPEAEAERYVSALNLGGSVDYFILIEPGQGYLISALRKRRHGCKPVVLHADTAFRETECLYPEVPMWFPDSGTGVQEFLEANIPEAAAVRIIEWRPSLNVYGESCLSLFRESGDFIKRQEAGRRTASAFGRRWVRNFFRNLAIMRNAVLYRPMDLPIVI
ncbi:MAG: hypothetical protein FWH38_05785, partial [Treponema sp.]|nr:hypothetical protein [Treponema sp.]